MRGRRPSTTAAFVACGRGAAGVDPFAARLVPAPYAWLAGPGRRLLALSPLVDLMRLRTRVLDDAALDAVRDGVTQVVILGAGLDARAWRLEGLERCTVYEVDHPATQREKRLRLAGLTPRARDVRFVGVDFERDDLSTALAGAGHEALARTVWIWEGVIPYLSAPAVEATLGVVRERSPAGSVLAATYVPALARALPLRALELGLRVMGEPFHCLLSTSELHRMLDATGFAVKDDASYAELAERYALPPPRPSIAATERAVVAVAT